MEDNGGGLLGSGSPAELKLPKIRTQRGTASQRNQQKKRLALLTHYTLLRSNTILLLRNLPVIFEKR